MLKELDRAVLTADLPDEGLAAGDVGVVVYVYKDGEAYEVEFMSLDGNTIAVATVDRARVRGITSQDMAHSRTLPA